MSENVESRWEYNVPEPGQLITFSSNLWGYRMKASIKNLINNQSKTTSAFDSPGGFFNGDKALCVEIINLKDLEYSQELITDCFEYQYCFRFLIKGEVIFVYEWDYQIAMGRVI